MSTKLKIKSPKKPYRIGLGLKRIPKQLWLAVGTILFLPLIALIGKENNPYNSYYLKEISKTEVEGYKEYSTFKFADVSYGKLVRGTRDYNGGNYVVYLGTETCGHCAKFLFGNDKYSNGVPQIGQTATDASWLRGDWGQAILAADQKQLKLKFLMYEDIPPTSLNKTSDVLWTFPWTKSSETNIQDTLSKSQTPGQYVRYDESAVKFRAIFDFAKSNKYNLGDPETKTVTGTPAVILFKNGIGHLWDNSENFSNFLITYYQSN